MRGAVPANLALREDWHFQAALAPRVEQTAPPMKDPSWRALIQPDILRGWRTGDIGTGVSRRFPGQTIEWQARARKVTLAATYVANRRASHSPFQAALFVGRVRPRPMTDRLESPPLVDHRVAQLFALVKEALAGATESLLSVEPVTAQAIIDADEEIDDLTSEVDRLVWERIDAGSVSPLELRHLVAVLLILPELERSADLAEHIAQRAARNLGAEMNAVSRGLVQRMSEVALDMWGAAANAYADRQALAFALNEADEEIDWLHARLTDEIANGGMSNPVATEVTLLARFYERLGDHAVNLARRIARFSANHSEAVSPSS